MSAPSEATRRRSASDASAMTVNPSVFANCTASPAIGTGSAGDSDYWPGDRPSRSSDCRAVSPFISSLHASICVLPAGARKNDGACIQHNLLAVSAVASFRNHHGHHGIANPDTRRDVGAHLVHGARDVHPRTSGGGSTFCWSARSPLRAFMSVGFTAAA